MGKGDNHCKSLSAHNNLYFDTTPTQKSHHHLYISILEYINILHGARIATVRNFDSLAVFLLFTATEIVSFNTSSNPLKPIAGAKGPAPCAI